MQASPSIQKLMLQNPQFFLNTALCQFPPRASKTEKAIIYLKHVSLNARINNGPIENGIHHMTVVFTNNNLLETKNWKLRLNRKTENMNIFSLSSKRDSDFNQNFLGQNQQMIYLILLQCVHMGAEQMIFII